jgi:hypothetical protein
MINLNNAEKQLLERHPSLATALRFEEYAELDNQIEETQMRTFTTQLQKGKLILEIEEKLKDQEVKAMLEDMEMTWTPTDIQRILRISKTWYYRLKKAAQFNLGRDGTNTRNLYKAAIKKAKAEGQEVKIDIDSFNKVAKAKADAMKAADTTRYSEVPANVREDVLNSLIDTDTVTPEEVAADIREQADIHFSGTVKLIYNGQTVNLNFKKKRNNDPVLECNSDNHSAKERMVAYLRVIANQMLTQNQQEINTIHDEN